MRQRKNYMEIGRWEELILLLYGPHFLVEALTFRAVSIAAAVVTYTQMTATITSVDMATQRGRSTSLDSLKRASVVRRKFMVRQLI
jgi:hypothetical protein